MKKQYTLIILFFFNTLIAMDTSLMSIFGLDQKYSNLSDDIQKELISHITSHQWWYVQSKSHTINTVNEKISMVEFSPFGNKIAAQHLNKINIYETNNATLETTFPGEDIKALVFNKKETKLWGVGTSGRRFYADINEKKVDYTFPDGSIQHLWDNFEINDTETEAIMGGWCKQVLIDTITGEVKKKLWEHYEQKNNNTMCAHFIKNTPEVHVFHNGFLNDHKNDEQVKYKAIIPEEAYLPLYASLTNRLVYFTKQDNLVRIVNCDTQEVKMLGCYLKRRGNYTRKTSLIEESRMILLIKDYSRYRIEDFTKNSAFVDVYDMNALSLIITIPLNSVYSMCLQGDLLLLFCLDETQLWDIRKKYLLARFAHKGFAGGKLNHFGNKIVIAEDNIMVWNLYDNPTLKQLLLKRLLTLWWQVKHQFYSFDSPELWLHDVAQLFSLDKTKENKKLKEELIMIWHSFPQYMQNTMWNTLGCKISSLRITCSKTWINKFRNKNNISSSLQTQAPAYIPAHAKKKRKK